MLIIGISGLFALLVFSPYIAGVLQASPGTTFAGVVHYPIDYYYYLSFMAQGKLRWLTSFNINTQEVPNAVFYHWLYVLSGRVFATLGISDIAGYQILILGATILLLFVSYRLIHEAIPSRSGSTVAFILFLASNTWPFLIHSDRGWIIGYFKSWYNFGEPFIRFSSVPHNLFAQALIVSLLLLLARIGRIPRSRYLLTWILFLLSGFLLTSTQTPLVLVVLLTCTVFWAKDIVQAHDPKKYFHAALTSHVFPALVLITAGAVPYTVYLRRLLQTPPYNIFAGWEVTQSIHYTFLQYFQLYGPVVLLGIIGLPIFLYAKSTARRIITVCTLISWGIFLSPIPDYAGVLNIRFLSVVPTLAMACSTAILIESVSRRFTSRIQKPILIGMVILIVSLTLPATISQILLRLHFNPNNAYIYIPDTVMDAFRYAEQNIKPQETCLVTEPFYESFAGLTGRRAFIANGFSTYNFQSKELQQNTFFSDTTPIPQKMHILTSNNISCVVTYSFTRNLPPALTPVYSNSFMAVYRVGK